MAIDTSEVRVALREMRDAGRAALAVESQRELETRGRSAWPIDTAFSIRAWHGDVINDIIQLINFAEYSSYVEYRPGGNSGGPYMPAHTTLRNGRDRIAARAELSL